MSNWKEKTEESMRNSSQTNYIVKINQRQKKILIAWIEEGLQMFDKGLRKIKN